MTTMQKFKVYGTKKNVTVEVPCSYTIRKTDTEIKRQAKKKGAGKILQIDDLDTCS